jgi:hypothetical protein
MSAIRIGYMSEIAARLALQETAARVPERGNGGLMGVWMWSRRSWSRRSTSCRAGHKTRETLARPASSFPPALHPDLGLLAELGGALVRRVDRQTDSSRRSSQHAATGERHPPPFIDHHNQNPKPFVWTSSADQISESVAAFVNGH